MTKQRFQGVLAPVITPFNEDLSVDKASFIKHCQWLINQQVSLAVFGTNSEANSLSLDEKIELLECLCDAGIDASRLMPGTGSCALTDAVSLTRLAVELGCGGVLMLPPFFYKGVSDDGLFAFYSEVIQRVANKNLSVYLYHIPPFSQIPLSVELIDRLVNAYPDTVVGIKDSSSDWSNTQSFLDGGWPDFRVFCGSESFLLQNMKSGGAGCISATANVNPAAIHGLYQNWEAASAEQMQADLNRVRHIFQSFPMIPALKAATALFSDNRGWFRVRPPIMELETDTLAELQKQLAAENFEMPGI